MSRFTIGNHLIQRDGPSYFIAEIGGNFTTVKDGVALIHSAKRAGAQAVKLQTFKADTLATRNAKYDMANTGKVSQYDLFKQYELDEGAHRELYAEAHRVGIDIFSTPSHITDIDILEKLGSVAYKIGGDDTSNLEFIYEVARIGKPILLSTGTCTLFEVDKIVDTILSSGNSNFCIMHAITSYPTPLELANLAVIKTFLDRYKGIVIGYSDHTIGPVCAIAARAMGAQVLERHYTLDKTLPGPDHVLSSDEPELKFIIDSIKTVESAMGSGVKMPMGQELINRMNNRKSLVLAKDVKAGDRLTPEHVAVKRPGTGISPQLKLSLMGRKVAKDLHQDHVFTWSDFE